MFKVGDNVKTKDCYKDIESFKGVIDRIIRTDCSYCGKNKLWYEVENLCGDTRRYCECCLEYDTDCRFKIGDHVKTTKEWHREPFSGTVVWWRLSPDVVVKNKCGTEVHHYRDLELDITKLNNTMSSTDICDQQQLLIKAYEEIYDLKQALGKYKHSVKIGLDTCSLAFTLGLGIGMFIIYVIMNL